MTDSTDMTSYPLQKESVCVVLQRLDDAFAAHNADAALRLATEAIHALAKQPESERFLMIASIYSRFCQFKEAITALEALSTKEDISNTTKCGAWLAVGKDARSAFQPQIAIQCFNAALAWTSVDELAGRIEVLSMLAESLIVSGRLSEARSALSSILELDHAAYHAKFQLAQLEYRLDPSPAKGVALVLTEELLHAGAVIPKVWQLMGKIRMSRNEFSMAIGALERSVLEDKMDADSWSLLGNVYFIARDTARAIHALQTALAINPSRCEEWFNLGNIFLASGFTAEAEAAFARSGVPRLHPGPSAARGAPQSAVPVSGIKRQRMKVSSSTHEVVEGKPAAKRAAIAGSETDTPREDAGEDSDVSNTPSEEHLSIHSTTSQMSEIEIEAASGLAQLTMLFGQA